MFRNLVNQRGSLTLTLPKNWVEKNRLKPKDQVSIEEVNKDLIISSTKGKATKEIEVDASEMSSGSLRAILGYLYRVGYDVIRVSNVKKEMLSLSFNNMVGAIVTNEGSYQKISVHCDESAEINPVVDKLFITISVWLNEKKNETFFRNQILELKDFISRSVSKSNSGFSNTQKLILISHLSGFASYLLMNKDYSEGGVKDFEKIKKGWLKRDSNSLIKLSDYFYKKRKRNPFYEWLHQIDNISMQILFEENVKK